MSQLHHENIVSLIEYIESPSSCYVVMEYCDGGDLDKLLKTIIHFSECDAILHLKEILNGFKVFIQFQNIFIKALHEKNIMHRDFKAANIFIKDEVFKIGDFGFAKQIENNLAETILGTPLYMSPELLESERYTNKSDIWAIGIVFYQILFGAVPFIIFYLCCLKLFNRFIAKTEIQLLSLIKKNEINFSLNGIHISTKTQQLIQSMLTPDPEKRIDWYDLFNHPAFDEQVFYIIIINNAKGR